MLGIGAASYMSVMGRQARGASRRAPARRVCGPQFRRIWLALGALVASGLLLQGTWLWTDRAARRGIGGPAAERRQKVPARAPLLCGHTARWVVTWSEQVSDGRAAISFDWREFLPELEPVHRQLTSCATGLLESVPIEDMSRLYTCDVPRSSRMLRSGQCVEAGLRHRDAILNESLMSDTLLSSYRTFEQEDRGHGTGLSIACGNSLHLLDQEEFEWLGQNLTIGLLDRTPCHSSYQLRSSGRGNLDVLGPANKHFATTHHLGCAPPSTAFARNDPTPINACDALLCACMQVSCLMVRDTLLGMRSRSISYKKGATPCSQALQDSVGTAFGATKDLQYASTRDSYRGLYWYPPGGFTEWHTDGSQVHLQCPILVVRLLPNPPAPPAINVPEINSGAGVEVVRDGAHTRKLIGVCLHGPSRPCLA